MRKLQDECERWGIRVSGTKKELIQRLTTLFQGHPVARKGCSKQFVMLSEEEVPGMKTPIYESPSPKVKTLEVASHTAPPPLPSGSSERGVGSGGGYEASSLAVYESPDRRSFRRDKSDPVIQDMEQRGLIRPPAASTSMASPSPSKSEPVGFMPREIGQILHDVPCSACGGDMLLRENRRRFEVLWLLALCKDWMPTHHQLPPRHRHVPGGLAPPTARLEAKRAGRGILPMQTALSCMNRI